MIFPRIFPKIFAQGFVQSSLNHCRSFNIITLSILLINIELVTKHSIMLLFGLRDIMPAVRKNKEQAKTNAAYNIVMGADMNEEEVIAANRRNADQMANVIDIR